MQLTQSVHRAASVTPDTPMTICDGRERTFAESIERIAGLAGALRELGVEPGDRVAMLAANADHYLEFLYATWWAGGVVNPVNTRWSAAEIAFSLQDSGTEVLIVDPVFAPALEAIDEHEHPVRLRILTGDARQDGLLAYEELVAAGPAVDDARRGGTDLAGIFYTGGTTGFPKGVMLSHQALLSSALGSLAGGEFVVPGGRLLHCAPMFHLAGLAAGLGQSALGGTHVIVPGFEPRAVMAAIAEHQVSHVLLVPTMIQMLLDHPSFGAYDLGSLRRIVYGGSPITLGVLERAAERLPGVEFTQAYGMTELSPVATLLGPADHAARRKLTAAGRPAPHVELHVAGPDGAVLPRGEVGEIVVRSPGVMSGYWERPEETAAVLRDGCMHTGDAGYLDEDGYLFVVDRIKDMVVTGGENVYCAEVETALSTHPAVAACAVIGLPDADWGERVHAVVVLADGADATLDDLRAHAKARIASYKVPRSAEFVDALPLSGAGKVLKRDLRARHLDPAS